MVPGLEGDEGRLALFLGSPRLKEETEPWSYGGLRVCSGS